MISTAFYIVPLLPGGIFLGTLALLLVVPVFALAALALVLLVGLAILLALLAAIIATPVLVAHLARRRWPTWSSSAAPRALRDRPAARFNRRRSARSSAHPAS